MKNDILLMLASLVKEVRLLLHKSHQSIPKQNQETWHIAARSKKFIEIKIQALGYPHA